MKRGKKRGGGNGTFNKSKSFKCVQVVRDNKSQHIYTIGYYRLYIFKKTNKICNSREMERVQ